MDQTYDLRKDLENFLKPCGEKALSDYRAKSTQDLQQLSERQKNLLKDSEIFKNGKTVYYNNSSN